MEHLNISEAAIVGRSVGGQMAARFALLYPEKTTHLVTINQVGLTDRRSGRRSRSTTPLIVRSSCDATDTGLLVVYNDTRGPTRHHFVWGGAEPYPEAPPAV